ncbi:MAG: VOC family protein [Bacillota bacterium]
MNSNIKYVHTNIVARDWKKLSQFYIDVFDCKPVYPERDLSGDWQGFGHIAFHVDSVEAFLKKVVEHGGGKLGEIIEKDYEDIGILTVVYAKDPEGNFIEIQNWRK